MKQVYDNAEIVRRSLTEVNTVFPSAVDTDGAMEGGLILMKLKPIEGKGGGGGVQVAVAYSDISGAQHIDTIETTVGVDMSSDIDTALAKGILLQTYVETCRDCLSSLEERTSVNQAEFAQKVEVIRSQLVASWADDAKMSAIGETLKKFSEKVGQELAWMAASNGKVETIGHPGLTDCAVSAG